VVVSPPLKGARWIVGGGCCTPYSYHRGATLPINGTIHVAERYAIDFVQLNDNKMLYSGPQDQLSSYAFFGTEIHSVADGIVVQIADIFRGPNNVAADNMSAVSTETKPALERGDVFGPCLERSQSVTNRNEDLRYSSENLGSAVGEPK
jgi:hypothetical protein